MELATGSAVHCATLLTVVFEDILEVMFIGTLHFFSYRGKSQCLLIAHPPSKVHSPSLLCLVTPSLTIRVFTSVNCQSPGVNPVIWEMQCLYPLEEAYLRWTPAAWNRGYTLLREWVDYQEALFLCHK